MIADVEKKIEGSLIEKLENEVARLTAIIEAGDEDKDRAKFESEYSAKEIDKLKNSLKEEQILTKDLKNKLLSTENELEDIKSSFNKLNRDYDKTKHDLSEANEKAIKWQNMYEGIKASVAQDKQGLEEKNTELNEQLDEYAEAYKVLEEKYKDALQKLQEMPKQDPKPQISSQPTPLKKEDKKSSAEDLPKDSSKDLSCDKIEPTNETNISALKKKVSEDIEAKKALRELIKKGEDTIKKQKENIDAMQKQLDSQKAEITYCQSQLTQKNSQVKTLTMKINELMQKNDSEGKKAAPEEKKNKPKTAASVVKQKLKQEKLEKVEAKPYLFGPKMDDVHDDLDDFNND